MGKISKILVLVVVIIVAAGQKFSSEEGKQPTDVFLKERNPLMNCKIRLKGSVR